jgi:hypothetical protein
MNKYLVLCLGVMSILLTGCPHNQYIIHLTPRDKAIERELSFYREDGTNKDGTIKYETFLADELAAITKLYPPGSVTHDKERHQAKGRFANVLPSDVSGAGSYTNLTTSLGSAGLYMERFRGDDDMAGSSARRMNAIDQLVDLIIGWSKVELGKEPNYEDLRKFLDGDFRKDVKNLGFSVWTLQVTADCKKGPYEEVYLRLGQYLMEHGYLKMQDWPNFFHAGAGQDPYQIMPLIRRLVAVKLGVPETKPSLAVLADETAAGKSWDNYLVATEYYCIKLEEWEKKKLTEPDLRKPEASEVTGDLFGKIIQLGIESDDHLTVLLALPSKPVYTNGKWDETKKQVMWDAELESGKDDRGPVRMPVFCYANWSSANEVFQKDHFGKVLLAGFELIEYCAWHAGLNEKQMKEWETLLTSLKSGERMVEKLDAFQFSETSVGVKENPQPPVWNDAEFPRQLIKEALKAGGQ